MLHEPQQKELLSPLTAVSRLPLEQAEPLYDALRIAAEVSLTDPGSMVEGVSNRLRLLPPERRVAIGVARHRGEEVPLLLFTVANAVANQLSRDADQRIQQRVVGLASAQISGPVIPPSVPADEHRPGRSVAHFAGTAGSLGAYVEWADAKTGRKVLGFLGASHVLARSGQADPGDHIHSPGVPDADNNIAWRYGRLANARALVHAEDTTAEGAYVNDCDIAVARLTKACHPQNRVPGLDPNEGLNPVIRAVSDDELRRRPKITASGRHSR